jgi:hypothetical protein
MDEVCWERVYLARHGQTEWNAQGRRQGQLDSPNGVYWTSGQTKRWR